MLRFLLIFLVETSEDVVLDAQAGLFQKAGHFNFSCIDDGGGGGGSKYAKFWAFL